jgi:hypothetical protein
MTDYSYSANHLKEKYTLVNKGNLVHNFSWYVYFFPLHVLGDYVPINRRNNCTYEG